MGLFVVKYLKNAKCFPFPEQQGARVKRMRDIMGQYATACKDDASVTGKVPTPGPPHFFNVLHPQHSA